MSASKAFQESKTDMRELQRGTEAKSITPARVYWFAHHPPRKNIIFAYLYLPNIWQLAPSLTSATLDHIYSSVSIYYVRQQHIQHHQSWFGVQLRPIATESSSFLRLPGPSDTSPLKEKVNCFAQVEDRAFENHSGSISSRPSKRIHLSACHNIIWLLTHQRNHFWQVGLIFL